MEGIQLWDLVPAALGAVLGAAAAAVPAYHLAVKGAREVLKRDSIQRASENQARAFRLLTTFGLIANSIFTMRAMIRQMLESRVAECDPTPTQRRVSAVIGLSYEAHERFLADDLAILAASIDRDLATDFSRFAASHAAICSSLTTYERLKLKNHDLLSDGASHEIIGDVVRTTINDPKLAAKIRLTDAQLESTIVQIIDMIEADCRDAIQLANRFNAVMDGEFQEGHRPHLDFSGVLQRFPDLSPTI